MLFGLGDEGTPGVNLRPPGQQWLHVNHAAASFLSRPERAYRTGLRVLAASLRNDGPHRWENDILTISSGDTDNRTARGPNMYRSKVDAEFRRRIANLSGSFDTARAFLEALVNNRVDDFWLGAPTNAHLYYKTGYYAYVKPTREAVEFLPGPNQGRIYKGTEDKHHLLFIGPINNLANRMGGMANGWAQSHGDGITVTNRAPTEFFYGLLDLIRTLDAEGDLG